MENIFGRSMFIGMLKEMFKKTKYISLDSNSSVKRDQEEVVVKKKETVSTVGNVVYDEIDLSNVDKVPAVPDGAWIKCKFCNETLFFEDVEANLQCCPKCKGHFRIGARERILTLVDENSFQEFNANIETKNVLEFPNYEQKIASLQEKTGLLEGVITGEAKINDFLVALACMDASFLMGSMGQVVGEKITSMIEKATEKNLPVIIFTTSGGARMQEGIISLMQMAKTSGAIKRHSERGNLTITVLTDPTTGGVTASFAMLGDIILAEPNALIGFAGPRVIEQTIGQKLPEGFQKSEFLLEKGFIDAIVPRHKMRETLAKLLKMHHK